jgi:hypothetical protein
VDRAWSGVAARNPVPERNRLTLDVTATDRDQEGEVERLAGLGARPVDHGQGDDADRVVLADPKGQRVKRAAGTVAVGSNRPAAGLKVA